MATLEIEKKQNHTIRNQKFHRKNYVLPLHIQPTKLE